MRRGPTGLLGRPKVDTGWDELRPHVPATRAAATVAAAAAAAAKPFAAASVDTTAFCAKPTERAADLARSTTRSPAAAAPAALPAALPRRPAEPAAARHPPGSARDGEPDRDRGERVGLRLGLGLGFG